MKVVTIITVVATIVVALVIMAGRFGLVDSLDFGAGSYYYADIPDFERFVRQDVIDSGLPLWLAIVLFLVWGALMYGLWVLVDRKK